MESSFNDNLTRQVFDEYFKEGEMVEFATLKALWDVINPTLMSGKVQNMKGGYSAFLNTIYWKTVSEEVKRRAGYRCQLCNSDKNLNAHHRCYDHKGTEVLHMEDLICLCHDCHEHHHKGRERIADLECENTLMKHYEMMSKTYSERIIKLEGECKALRETTYPLIDPIPSDKAHEYFDNMNTESLRKKCMELYDTFLFLKDCQSEVVELKKKVHWLENKIPSEKWQRPEWFDNPPEDEITCF